VTGKQPEISYACYWNAFNGLDELRTRFKCGSDTGSNVSLWLFLVESLEIVLTTIPQYKTREIALGIRINQHDSMPLFRQFPSQVEYSRSLANPAFMVEECDLLGLAWGRGELLGFAPGRGLVDRAH
jgi:hypothetical protein